VNSAENPYRSPQLPPDVSAPTTETPALARPIEMSGVLSVSDAFHACALGQRTKLRRFVFWCRLALLAIVGGFLLVLLVSTFYSAHYAMSRVALTALAVIAVLVATRPAWYRVRAGQLWKRRQGLFGQTHTTITEDMIEMRTENSAAQLKWAAFCAYRHSDRVAILYLEFPGPFTIIAREKFVEDAQWPVFLCLLEKKLPKR